MSFTGHIWTVGALARRTLAPSEPPPWEAWATTLEDSVSGTVAVNGKLHPPASARELVVLVHGLGGSSDSDYVAGTARAAAEFGLASLQNGASVSWRGKVSVDLGRAARTVADVLAGDFEGYAARDIPADDVVAQVVKSERSETFEVVQLRSLADLGPGLPDALEVLVRAAAGKEPSRGGLRGKSLDDSDCFRRELPVLFFCRFGLEELRDAVI